jgi:ABC-type amino acid transport substrate-binding protein
MKKYILILLLYAFSFFALAQSNSNPDGNSSNNNKIILTVATTEDGYFPYYYKEDNELKGLSVDFLNYFEQHSKYDFEFVIMPWPRALYLVAHNKVDLVLTIFKTPEREKTYHFIEPSYGDEANQLFTLVENTAEFTGELQQLTSYSIGTLREYSYGDAFDKAGFLDKSPALTESVLLKLLLGRRIDMVISNPLIFNNLILKENVNEKVKALEPYIAITPVYMALTKGRDDSKIIEETLGRLSQQFKASADYKALLDKYQLNYQ